MQLCANNVTGLKPGTEAMDSTGDTGRVVGEHSLAVKVFRKECWSQGKRECWHK